MTCGQIRLHMKTKIRAKKSWLQSHLLLVLGGSFIINAERFHGRGSSTSNFYSAS